MQERKVPLAIEYVDAFVGKLADVGIPASQGILVSATGFTRDARRRAAKAGIRVLRLEVLDQARLSAEINAALLQLVHFVLFIESMSMFSYLPPSAQGEHWPDGLRFNEREIHNFLWKRWVTETETAAPEEKVHFFVAGDRGASVRCRIVAFVGRVTGRATLLRLRNAASDSIERGRFEATFDMPHTLQLEAFDGLERLQEREEALRRDGHLVVQRIRVPRIVDVTGKMFWPPSRKAVEKIVALRAAGEQPTFANVEGRDLSRAWEVFELQRGTTKRSTED